MPPKRKKKKSNPFLRQLLECCDAYKEPEPCVETDNDLSVVHMDPHNDCFSVTYNCEDKPVLTAFFQDNMFLCKTVIAALLIEMNKAYFELVEHMDNDEVITNVLRMSQEIRTAMCCAWCDSIQEDHPVADYRNNQIARMVGILFCSLKGFRLRILNSWVVFCNNWTGEPDMLKDADSIHNGLANVIDHMYCLINFGMKNHLSLFYYEKYHAKSVSTCGPCIHAEKTLCNRKDGCLYANAFSFGRDTVGRKEYVMALLKTVVP